MSVRTGNKIMINVGSDTNTNKLALCIKANYEIIKLDGEPEIILRYIGASAGNQAIKALILLNVFLSSDGITAYAKPNFATSHDMSRDKNKEMVTIEMLLKFSRT